MQEQERFIVPGLGVVIVLSIFVIGAPLAYQVLLVLLGVAAVGTYFLPHGVQVETRIAIAAIGLLILIFITSLGFWAALLSFAGIGALQLRHRDTLQNPPHTVGWLNSVLARRGGAGGAAPQADAGDGDDAPSGRHTAEDAESARPLPAPQTGSPAQIKVPHIVAWAASTMVVIAAFLPWATALGVGVAGIEGDGVITLVLGVMAAAAIAAGAFWKRWAAIPAAVIGVAVAGIGVYDWVQIETEETFNVVGLRGVVSVGVGLYLTAIAGVVLALAGAWAFVAAKKSA